MTTDKEKWIYLLKNASEIREKEVNALKKEPIFQRALERLERLSSDPATRKAYEASINEHRDHMAVLSAHRKEGLNEGLKEGWKKGRKEEKLEIARTMQKENFSIDQISNKPIINQRNSGP